MEVEMKIRGLMMDPVTNMPIVVLKDVNGSAIRFMVIHKQNGDYATALDACQICGRAGYRQDGQNVICRNCAAAIYIPSIGESGGCNPIAVKSQVAQGEVIVDLSALADSASRIHS